MAAGEGEVGEGDALGADLVEGFVKWLVHGCSFAGVGLSGNPGRLCTGAVRTEVMFRQMKC